MLIEAMIASVILAAACVATADLLLATYTQAQTLRQTTTATMLAEQLIEEISQKPLTAPFGVTVPNTTPATREDYVVAGQFNGYNDTTSAMATADGNAVTVGEGETYARTVTISTAPADYNGTTSAAGDFAVVTVTVTMPCGQSVTLTKLISNNTWSL